MDSLAERSQPIGRRLGSAMLLALPLLLACPSYRGQPIPRILDVDELQIRLDEQTLLLLDVRAPEEFEAGHLPRAHNLPADTLRAEVDGIEGQVVPRPMAAEVFALAGIAPEADVIVYGEANGTAPSRVAWTLEYYGHDGAHALLDGGVEAWVEADNELQTGAGPAGDEAYASDETRGRLRVDKDWVLEHLEDEDVVLIDVRSDEEFEDGYIPGARHVEWTRNLDGAGRFRVISEIAELHGNPTNARTLVTYCRTGSRASVAWAALKHVGYDDVRIYDGSWTEWSADPNTPKEMP